MIRTYTELMSIDSFLDRFNYLQLFGEVGKDTFGYDRYLNQAFYKSAEWKRLRNDIILRDDGCDLAHPDYQIVGRVYIHHLNPVTKKDVLDRSDLLLNPEYLVCVSYDTHQAIHYGDANLLPPDLIIRRPDDTCPWR